MPAAGIDTEDVIPKNTGRFLPPGNLGTSGRDRGKKKKKANKTITDYEKYRNNNTQWVIFCLGLSGRQAVSEGMQLTWIMQ